MRLTDTMNVANGLPGVAVFRDDSEASGYVVPDVPQEIRRLAEYAELFTANDVWRQLRQCCTHTGRRRRSRELPP